ncbi:MAG: hypothetical protein SWY16_26905 [Cyanobacteriota bacterium]|nr:hypothetical protein [Cyanobacteriota bacterium]
MQSCFCCQPTRNSSYICPTCWEIYSARALQEMEQTVDTVEKYTPSSLYTPPRWRWMKCHLFENPHYIYPTQ